MDSRADVERWISGVKRAKQLTRRLAATQAKRDRQKTSALSLALSEIACRVERSPAARARRERETAAVRALWRRAAREAQARSSRRPNGRSEI